MQFNQQNYITSQISCMATFHNFYGIGKIKAKRLNSFFLNHPHQTIFSKDFDDLMDTPLGNNLLRLPLDAKIRLYVSHNILDQMQTFCYKAHRLCQNLPGRGGRSRCNSKTQKKYFNPYLSLRVNQSLYPSIVETYKIRELNLNARYNELEAFKKALSEKEAQKNKVK